MDTNECAFLIEKGKLYNCMTILIIVSMRHQSRITRKILRYQRGNQKL